MNSRNDWLEDLQRNISELIAKSPAADIERNVRAMMAQTFSKLDLVTREEFDVQKELLERLFERVAALELRIQALEGAHNGPDAEVAVATTGGSADTTSKSGESATGAAPSETATLPTSDSSATTATTDATGSKAKPAETNKPDAKPSV